MIDKIKALYGENTEVVSVQEYFTDAWNNVVSTGTVSEQITECEENNASILSVYIKIETTNEETGDVEMVDSFPDVFLG